MQHLLSIYKMHSEFVRKSRKEDKICETRKYRKDKIEMNIMSVGCELDLSGWVWCKLQSFYEHGVESCVLQGAVSFLTI